MWGIRRRVVLQHRQQINEFLRPLKLYRSSSLQVAFRNPTNVSRIHSEKENTFDCPEVAFRRCSKKQVPIHAD